MEIFDEYDAGIFKSELTKEERVTFKIIQGIVRPGIGYLFQSLAFLVNIHRWERILAGSKTGTAMTIKSIKKTIT